VSLWIKSQSSHCSLYFYFLSSIFWNYQFAWKLQLISLYYFTFFVCDVLIPPPPPPSLCNPCNMCNKEKRVISVICVICVMCVIRVICIISISSNLSFFQIYTALGLIWKQDLMIKPYILILLYIIDVFVFILKMTCWCRNKATTPCVTYTANDFKIMGRRESCWKWLVFCSQVLAFS